ncbi:DNA excision repair protein ERCC-1 [Bos taurus] [Rhizoctonia solani]|uniref:DNA excision repair protein ERCC-1 n=1 Tax=Rhizoctonia solani TaxID=456999 RepID=A0A0K6FX92_9AGAM|nr:DNA excision repair protein ERCC-1 [Bos taurus] [Rhizoctonia solani]
MSRAELNTSRDRVPPAASNALTAKAAKSTVGNAILVHKRQKGNPILDHVKGVPWEYNSDIIVDYQVGSTAGLLYLSLKYHHLHPQYIFTRFEKLGRNYDIRILLILCDVTEHQNSIRELTKACLLNGVTVVVAWSAEEAGQYLATYKLYEFKSHQLIKERVDADYQSVLRAVLTTVRGVNKTDVMTLKTNFGSFSNVVHATTEDMQLCPGFGPTKVRRLREAFNKPFYSTGQKPLGINNDMVRLGVPMEAESSSTNTQSTQEIGRRDSPRPGLEADRSCRYSSPEWDIEHSSAQTKPKDDAELSLELNPSDEDMPPDL